MSREMLAVFFPASEALNTRLMPSHYENVMPTDCPVALWPFAWSTLVPLCLLGAVTGLWGFLRVHQRSYKQSFLHFAGMNISAAICHCFTPLSSPFKPLMVGLDVGFTCAASICLCLGALTSGARGGDKLYANLSVWLPPAAVAVAVLGNHVGALNAATGLRSVPFLNELMYIQTTLTAVYLVFTREVLQPGLTSQQRTAILASAASFLAVLGLTWVNPWLCKLPFHFDLTHVLFLGCDLSYCFLGKYLILMQQSSFVRKATKQG